MEKEKDVKIINNNTNVGNINDHSLNNLLMNLNSN